ncbi:hypothetical protein OG727_34180 [Streptomyces caniferus]|uniref:Bulb-type lectin domain-containing protein n=1 Tax=Streptomyces caniferus TaxID=285557 RepID=A0ABZ1VVV1_9ACTN|nr:hypothetical protein [Streptomyces caniferus]
MAPNKLWTHATEIGSGDYTGNDNWDLIVRWSDGELTNYQDFTGGAPWGENKLHGPDSTWTHALIVSGGDYSDNPHADDTIVRWSDGELTLYTDGNAQSIGRENQLVAPQPLRVLAGRWLPQHQSGSHRPETRKRTLSACQALELFRGLLAQATGPSRTFCSKWP